MIYQRDCLRAGDQPNRHGFALLRELLLVNRDDIYRRPSFLSNLRPSQTSSDLDDRGIALYDQFSGYAPSPSKTLTTLASDTKIWHKNCFCRRVDVTALAPYGKPKAKGQGKGGRAKPKQQGAKAKPKGKAPLPALPDIMTMDVAP